MYIQSLFNRQEFVIIHHYLNHRGAVLSVVMSSTGEHCFSGGVDGTIQCWNTPNPNIDPYDSYGNSVNAFLLESEDFLIKSR